METWLIGFFVVVMLGAFLVGAFNTFIRVLLALGHSANEVSLNLHLVEVWFKEEDKIEKLGASYEVSGYYRFFDAGERARFYEEKLSGYPASLDDLPGHLQKISGTAHILVAKSARKMVSQEVLNRIRQLPFSNAETMRYRYLFGMESLGIFKGNLGLDLLLFLVGGSVTAFLAYTLWSGQFTWTVSSEALGWLMIVASVLIVGAQWTRSPFSSEAKYPIAGTIQVREGIHPIYHDSRLEYKLREITSLTDEGEGGS